MLFRSGLEKNPLKAAHWLMKAANQSHAMALNNLGILYAKGEGVKQSFDIAEKSFQKAIALGCEDAENNLKRIRQKQWWKDHVGTKVKSLFTRWRG